MPDPFGRTRRNLTDELVEGATDGAVRKARPDTSNEVADATDNARDAWGTVEGSTNWQPFDSPAKRRSVRGLVRGA